MLFSSSNFVFLFRGHFEAHKLGPNEDLSLQFEAVSRMPDDEKRIIKALLDGMIVKYQTKQLMGGLSS